MRRNVRLLLTLATLGVIGGCSGDKLVTVSRPTSEWEITSPSAYALIRFAPFVMQCAPATYGENCTYTAAVTGYVREPRTAGQRELRGAAYNDGYSLDVIRFAVVDASGAFASTVDGCVSTMYSFWLESAGPVVNGSLGLECFVLQPPTPPSLVPTEVIKWTREEQAVMVQRGR